MRILPHLNMHLDHSLSNEGGAEESPKGNQEVPAGDSSQVEKGVWNAEKVEDRVKRRKRGEETLQLPGCQRSRPSPPIAGCHTWLAQTWRVISLHQRSWSVPSFLDIAKKASNLSEVGDRKTKLVEHTNALYIKLASLWSWDFWPTWSFSQDSSAFLAARGIPQCLLPALRLA